MGLVDITKRLSDVEAQVDYTRRWVQANNDLLTSVAAFDERIKELENNKYGTFSELLQAYASKFKKDGLGFIFFTDPHDMSGFNDYEILDHLAFLRTLYEYSPAKYVLCGGDWINTKHTLAYAKYAVGRVPNLMRNQICERSYTAVGNHDLNVENPADSGMTESELAQLWYDKDVGYYTIDTDKTTCFVFDSGNQSKEMTAYRWKQVEWFAEKLIENKQPHLFGLIHIIGVGQREDIQPPELANILTQMADAFNNRTTATFGGVLYDFTNVTGTFHFMLAGHYHLDHYEVVNNIPVIYTRNGRNADCCFADFDGGVLHMVRATLTNASLDADRDVAIIPSGDKQRIEVIWNNKLPQLSTYDWKSYNGENTTLVDNGAGMVTQTWLKEGGGYSFSTRTQQNINIVNGHVYYLSYMINPDNWDGMIFGAEYATYSTTVSESHVITSNKWNRISFIHTNDSTKTTANTFLGIRRGGPNAYEGATIKMRYPVLVDLTLMFGEGNEPDLETFETQCVINGVDLSQPIAKDINGTTRWWIV